MANYNLSLPAETIDELLTWLDDKQGIIIKQTDLLSGTGQSTTATMTQKAITDAINAGYLYKGIATPATNPGTPDANVFYLASEAGTYTNFGGIVINEGEVCALVWNGTWTKQVTGAATADQISQLGQQVIYDVTMNNSNHPTFASLLALLSDANLSTLIPANVRCGGMSIRFVQTSDNTYVQFRLMKNTWSTTPSDWQGVDTYPTFNSKGIAESGGVFNADLHSFIHTIEYTAAVRGFHGIPCSFHKGDKVIGRTSSGAVINDIYQRPIHGSSEGQKHVNITLTEDGFTFVATIDFEGIVAHFDSVGSVTIERDVINKTVETNDILDGSITEPKLAFDLSSLKAYVKASPSATFEGVYPQYGAKILAGGHWGTYIFPVQGVSKVRITYRGAGNAYGIAFSVNGDSVANFNSGTRSDWWSQYPDTSGTIEVNVPVGAKYLALAQKDMHNACELWTFLDLSGIHQNRLYGKTCIYIGDSISTENSYHWKGLLETEYGLEYVRDGSSLWPANGGITLVPKQTEPESLELKSIWYRCAEHRMDIYDFDVISLFGGTNDMVYSGRLVGDVDENGDYINIAEIVPFVDDASSFSDPSAYNDVWDDPTYAEALKGCIEMLHRDFPTKPIVVCSVLPCGGTYGNWVYEHDGSPIDGMIMSERLAITAMRIANYYQFTKGWDVWGVPFYWGIRTVESVAAFGDGVHPNRICAIRMMNMFKDSLMM